MASSNQIDPTRSITLRRSFVVGLRRAFAALRKDLYDLLVREDAFGLGDKPVLNVSSDTYEFSTTQVDVTDPDLVTALSDLLGLLNPEDVVKVEDEPHVTVRYGLYDGSWTLDSVKALTQAYPVLKYKIGTLSYFRVEGADGPVDVLKFSVESDDLVELNRRLGLLPNRQTYSYNPHLTVAYLKGGAAEKYLTGVESDPGYPRSAIEGREVVVRSLTYSSSQKQRTALPLGVPVLNRRWKYDTQEQAVENFDKYLNERVARHLMSNAEAQRWRKYMERGFHKGEARAFDDTTRVQKGRGARRPQPGRRGAGFVEGDREAFLRASTHRPVASEKLRLLQSRALNEVKGLADDLRNRGRRTLTDGLVAGLTPAEIAANLSKVLDVSLARAETIALTELVRAHAEGQLEALEQLGVEEVGVAVEWSTASDPCKACEPLKGIVLTIAEARGMLPRHPRCRCAWQPANVGEKDKTQKRSKTKIDRAVRKSEKEGADGSEWGPAEPISRSRPKPAAVFNHSNSCGCCAGLRAFSALLTELKG